MSVLEIFKRTAVRRLTLLFIAVLLGWLGLGNAHAQDYSACFSNVYGEETARTPQCPTRAEAYTQAIRACEANSGQQCKIHTVWEEGKGVRVRTLSNSWTTWRFWVEGCPSGTEWFESLLACDKPCAARNADLGTSIKWASSGDSQCIAECKYKIVDDYQTRAVTATVGGNTVSAGTLHGGRWEYTGDRCPVSPPPQPRDDEKPKAECTPATNGQTYCITSNGDACATASSGRMICWRPSETGTKTDGSITQTKTYGNESPNPPEGSEHVASQNITTTTTTNISTTTINTYTTTSGVPAGGSNQGTSVGSDGKPVGGDGSTSGNGTGGDGDDGNSSSGGGDCAAPPVSSGDALLSQIAHQAWATRCAIEDRNKAQDDEAAELAGQGDGLDGVSEGSIFKTYEAGDLNEDLLGTSGGMCSFGVPLELMGQPIELPPAFWNLASWIGMLVVASAYLWVAHKLGG